MANEQRHTEDAAPKYVAPSSLTAVPVPLEESQPAPHPAAVREGGRAAVPASERPMVAMRQVVRASDGEEIGQVKEVSRTHFKVDVPMRPDFWLALDDVASSDAGTVTLRFAEDDLDARKLDRPGPGEALLSEGEQFEQRRSMEADIEGAREPGSPVIGRRI